MAGFNLTNTALLDMGAATQLDMGAASRAIMLALILCAPDASATEWVPVAQEPRHRPVFENDQAIILEVNLPPGYVSLYHEHRIDLLYVTITGTQVWAQPLGGERMDADVVTGDLRFSSDNHDLPHIHQVGNVGSHPFHVIGIGRKDSAHHEADAIAIEGDTKGLTLDQQKIHASVYRIRLAPGEKTGVHQHNLPHARVFLTDGILSDGSAGSAAVSAGQFLWQPGGMSHFYENKGDQPLEIVEMQWR